MDASQSSKRYLANFLAKHIVFHIESRGVSTLRFGVPFHGLLEHVLEPGHPIFFRQRVPQLPPTHYRLGAFPESLQTGVWLFPSVAGFREIAFNRFHLQFLVYSSGLSKLLVKLLLRRTRSKIQLCNPVLIITINSSLFIRVLPLPQLYTLTQPQGIAVCRVDHGARPRDRSL